jgi:hypothetical protein
MKSKVKRLPKYLKDEEIKTRLDRCKEGRNRRKKRFHGVAAGIAGSGEAEKRAGRYWSLGFEVKNMLGWKFGSHGFGFWKFRSISLDEISLPCPTFGWKRSSFTQNHRILWNNRPNRFLNSSAIRSLPTA